MLVCDITIVMNPDKNISTNKLDTRKKAYDALNNKGKYAPVTSKSYSIVRKEMRDELGRPLDRAIKEVYFYKIYVTKIHRLYEIVEYMNTGSIN